MHLIVIAKEPVPGRVKTRLCPPCSETEAASIAEAALADTLDVVCRVDGVEPVVVLDGAPGSWLPAGMAVRPQRDGALDARLAAAFADVRGPALLIGMDTPQVSPDILTAACDRLASGHVDAVLGPAMDGGWWSIGLKRADDDVFLGVPMSTGLTLHAQRARLRERSFRVAELQTLRDVDLAEDAVAVAREIPDSRFAAAVEQSAIGRAAVSGVGV